MTPIPVGLYGNLWTTEWVAKGQAPPDFLILIARPHQPSSQIVRQVRQAKSRGIDVILQIQFYTDRRQRGQLRGAAPLQSIEYYMDIFARILDELSPADVMAITLDEESSLKRSDLLGALYDRLKARYPAFSFYQWYSPSRKPKVPGATAPQIPSDGWIVNPYSASIDDYETFIASMVDLGKPLVSLLWATPSWHFSSGRRTHDSAWWNDSGWQIFYARLATNRKFAVPTAFFAVTRPSYDPDSVVFPFFSRSPCDRQFMQQLMESTAPVLRSQSTIPLSIPKNRPDWIPGYCEAEKPN